MPVLGIYGLEFENDIVKISTFGICLIAKIREENENS